MKKIKPTQGQKHARPNEEKYIAYFHDPKGKLILKLQSRSAAEIISRSAVKLEDDYPNAYCYIVDTKKNRLIQTMKVNHCFE